MAPTEHESLIDELRRLRERVEEQDRELALLRDENARLREQLERARRFGKRQAAPFSKGPPKAEPKKPGRRPGKAYGPRARRPIPERVNEVVISAVRRSPVVSPDETGWRVGGKTNWLWVFVTEDVTVYAILPGRGFEQAQHQTCNAHLLRRCHELLETAQRGAARVPHAVRRILLDGLELRDRRDRGELSSHGVLVGTGRLGARMDRLLEWRPTDDENRKLLKHLRHATRCSPSSGTPTSRRQTTGPSRRCDRLS